MVNTVRRIASSSRASWLLWMTLGTLLLIPLVALDFVFEMLREARAVWKWRYAQEFRDYVSYFSERHRMSLRSLGKKPVS